MLTDREIDTLLEAIGQRAASEEFLAAWKEEVFGDEPLTAGEAFSVDVMRAEWLMMEREVLRQALSLLTGEEQRRIYDIHTSEVMERWLSALGSATEDQESKFETLLERYAEQILASREHSVVNMSLGGKKVLPS